MMATSGLLWNAALTASLPLRASATTCQPERDSKIARKPRRTTSWSSAIRMLVITGLELVTRRSLDAARGIGRGADATGGVQARQACAANGAPPIAARVFGSHL